MLSQDVTENIFVYLMLQSSVSLVVPLHVAAPTVPVPVGVVEE